jgi:hypothetical protein
MAESLDEFFSEDNLIDSSVRDEAALIHYYLAGSITVQIASQRLVQSLQARNVPLQNGQYDLSEIVENVIVSVAEQLPETHAALVVLLSTLKQQTETSNFECELAFALNERWLRYGDPDQSLILRDEFRNEWTNLNHFAALVYKANLQDLSSFAVKTLWMALRRGGWRVNYDGRSKSLFDYFSALISLMALHDLILGTSDSVFATEGHAPAAAQWIIVCGQRIYDESSDARGKWAEWEADLDWIAGRVELVETVKSLCQQTLAEMRRIAA